MHNSSVLAVLLLITAITKAQDKILPPEAIPFVPKGFEMLDYVTGDLNGDKKPDAILVLKETGEDSLEEAKRPLLLLVRQANGTLKKVVRNDKAILCRHCGGVFGDPYESITINPKGFEISFYGGSNWRWSYQYVFVYKPLRKNWFLAKETQVSTWTVDPENNTRETVILAKEFGEIPIDKFDSDPVSPESKWKVKAAKTYFYDNPTLSSKPRKAWLLNGNIATASRHLANFILVSYENEKGEFTSGYLLRKDLERIK